MSNTKYKEYEKMIQRIAWSFYRTTGIEFNELYSEANLSYCKALEKYDDTKSTLITFLYTCIKNDLIDFCKRELKEKEKKNNFKNHIDRTSVNTNIIELTKEAKEVLKIILEAPADTIKISMGGIIDYLKTIKKMRFIDARKIVHELRDANKIIN